MGRVVRGNDDIKAKVVLPEAGFPFFYFFYFFLNEVVRRSADFLFFFNQKLLLNSFVSHGSSNFVIQLGSKTRRLNGFISKAEKHSGLSRKSSWWHKFFFKDDGNWLGLTEAETVAAGEAERKRGNRHSA